MSITESRGRIIRSLVLSVILFLLPGLVRAEDAGPYQVAEQQGGPAMSPRQGIVTHAPVRASTTYYVEPFVGGGAASDFASTAYAKVGAMARYYLTRETNLGFIVSDSVYSQMYLTLVPNSFPKNILTGRAVDPVPVWVTEQKIDVEAHVRHRFPLGKGYWSLYPLGGLKGIFLQNGVLNSSMGGINVGLGLGYITGDGMTLDVGGDFLYDLIGAMSPQPTTSLMGNPWAALTYGAAVGFKLPPHYRLKVGYDGQTIFLQSIQRLYNGLLVSVIF